MQNSKDLKLLRKNFEDYYAKPTHINQRTNSIPNETEWLEFKQNNSKPDVIGEDISALANSIKRI